MLDRNFIASPFTENTGISMKLSFAVMAYKQEEYIQEVIEAVFAQDHPELEILLSDDCSPDGTFAIMEEMARKYHGPHKIILNLNEPNLGLINHINKIFELTTADYIIYNAGDDISEPHRASAIARVISAEAPFYIHSDVTDIHPDGQPFKKQRNRKRHAELEAMTLAELARAMSHGIGATACWHRDLFERFGPITEQGLYEDRVMLFRARILGKASYIEDRLVRYRRGIGLSSEKKHDDLKALSVDIATLRQRRIDLTKINSNDHKTIKAIDRKLGKRMDEQARAMADRNAD